MNARRSNPMSPSDAARRGKAASPWNGHGTIFERDPLPPRVALAPPTLREARERLHGLVRALIALEMDKDGDLFACREAAPVILRELDAARAWLESHP